MDMPKVEAKIPQNEEHFEKYQDDVNKKRLEFINSLKKEDKKNFLLVEKVVAKLDKSNIPFMLLVRPISEPKGAAWQYYKFHGDVSQFSDEGKRRWAFNFWQIVYAFNKFVCGAFKELTVTLVDMKKGQAWTLYDNEKHWYNPEIFGGPKPPEKESGDEWKS
jgi:hypothetical protein